jgi:hypothetical protein
MNTELLTYMKTVILLTYKYSDNDALRSNIQIYIIIMRGLYTSEHLTKIEAVYINLKFHDMNSNIYTFYCQLSTGRYEYQNCWSK